MDSRGKPRFRSSALTSATMPGGPLMIWSSHSRTALLSQCFGAAHVTCHTESARFAQRAQFSIGHRLTRRAPAGEGDQQESRHAAMHGDASWRHGVQDETQRPARGAVAGARAGRPYDAASGEAVSAEAPPLTR